MELISVNKLLKSIAGLALYYSIYQIDIATNPLNFYYFVALIRLVEAYKVYYETFFLGGAQLDEIFI